MSQGNNVRMESLADTVKELKPQPSSGFFNRKLMCSGIGPDIDFSGDGKVDRLDVGLLMVNWGTDTSLYDIAPTPFGDGIVDSKDLMLLAEHGAFLAGDVNYDGVVDLMDLAELGKNWLQQQP